MKKEVLEKLYAKEQKVELALIDDFKNLKTKTISKKDECLAIYSELKTKSAQLQSKIKEYTQDTIKLEDIHDVLIKKYSELGLNFKSSDEYKGYESALDKIDDILEINSNISKLK